jgi:chromosome segregation ATPase
MTLQRNLEPDLETVSERSNSEHSDPCKRTTCNENIASLEHQVGKAAVKVSRLERQLRQQEQETERQKQKNISLARKNEKMAEERKAMEAAMGQHMQMKDSLDKLEAPPTVLQQQLREERAKAVALKEEVQGLTTSSLTLRETAANAQNELQNHKAFINNYCRVTDNTFDLTRQTTTNTADHIAIIRHALRQIQDEEKKLPLRFKARIDKNLELRELSARQQGLTFKTDGKITKLRDDATICNATNRSRASSVHQREPSNTHKASSAGKRIYDGDVHPQRSHRISDIPHGGKRGRERGEAADVYIESGDARETKKLKVEDVREPRSSSMPRDPRLRAPGG